MKIALLGYGKMGKVIENIALSRGHEIVATIDKAEDWNTKSEALKKADVAIEFSIPEAALINIANCFKIDLPVVVGTTGWYDHLEEIKTQCLTENRSLFYASNFSIGVNIFFEINKRLAELMNPYPDYDVEMEETHHIHKVDAPSGTAITLANQVLENIDRKNQWKLDQVHSQDEMLIKAYREDEVPGTHVLRYESTIDCIEIRHEAKSRQGFALGSVLAAEFLSGKTGFFEMPDLLFGKKK